MNAQAAQVAVSEQMSLYESFQPWLFSDKRRRPTLVIVPFFKDRVLLVNPAKSPMNWWIPPQEGIRKDDFSIARALGRGLREELSLGDTDYVHAGIIITGPVTNRIPADRVDGNDPFYKVLVTVTVRLRTQNIVLNRDENNGYRWVSHLSMKRAMATVVERRPVKFQAVDMAMKHARKAYFTPRDTSVH